MNGPQTTAEAILQGRGPLSERISEARTWLDANLRIAPPVARRLIEGLLPDAEMAGDAVGAAWLRFNLGWLAIDADDYEHGIMIMEAAKSVFEDARDHEGISRCLNALGFATLMMGVHDLALDYLREAVEEAGKASRSDLAGTACISLAECLYELEEPGEALQVIEQCRKDYTVAPHNVTVFHSQAGKVYMTLGRLKEAEAELLKAIETAGDACHDALEARQILADVYIDDGRLEDAERIVDEGIEACAGAGERLLGTRFRLSRARIWTLRHRTRQAISDIEAALQTAQELGARKAEADAEKALYLAWQSRGESRKALAAFVRYSRLKDAMRSEQTSRRILGLHDERIRRETKHFESLYRQISTISEIGQRITANLDLDTTLGMLYEAINGLMDAPTLMIALVDEERRSLDYRLVISRGERKDGFTSSLDEESFGCWCVNHRQDVLIGDLESEFHRYVRSYKELVVDGIPEKSLVFIPLIVGEKVAGVLSVQSHIPNAYDKRKVEIVRAVGAYVAIAIENAGLFRQIQRLAAIDALTGLFNRRRLTEAVEETFRKTQRYKLATGVVMLDVDHFKKVNDVHGHDAGDAVLKAIARTLAAQVRNCDILGRFGGEEFVALLPETGLDGTSLVAERLRAALEALEVSLPEGGTLQVTASFGVSVILPGDRDHEAVLKRADRALYRAKDAGRNRVVVDGGA